MAGTCPTTEVGVAVLQQNAPDILVLMLIPNHSFHHGMHAELLQHSTLQVIQ